MTDSSNYNDPEMPLVSHLVELRSLVVRSLLAVAIVFLGLVYFANDIYAIVSKPLTEVLPEHSQVIATGIFAGFFIPLKLTIVVSIFAVMPYLLHQIWSFISPALYGHEKRFALPLLGSSIILFYLGLVFAYFVVFPLVFQFSASTTPDGVAYTPDITKQLDVMLKLFFAFGFAFEIPVATVLLLWSGLTTKESLKEKRPYVVVGIFVFAMFITPPDIFSQTLLAIPMWFLYELGIWFAVFFKPTPPESQEIAEVSDKEE
ncbi:twin-arginine translocase subunit TatC [Pleionea sp. CnH1-48]|uniref:twin-arginine translocase subunit TatC n=1 Tax=Pleionea sp. CnH1-48 TaxID=2954494 RepID=UPI00209821D8|nr:twin-arginine translocase subunit TatC [Pleionea sp. CnH1-48]MCO7224520.1 twin-arginine translocase subunit TatC [Pleionea sp. CnH1-48]